MRIEDKQKNRENWKLDRKEIDTKDASVAEAADLLYDIINESWIVSRDALEMTLHGTRYSLQDLYSHCKNLIEQIGKAGEKLAFLQMSVIEDCYNKAKQLVLVPLTDMLNNDMSALERAIRMEKLLANNPYKAMWVEKASQYRALLEKMGFIVSTDDYSDLSTIMEPLLDAFTFYKGKNHKFPPVVCKARSGVRSTKSPIFSLDTCMYGSELEFVTALENSREESIMAFGGIKKKNKLQHNYFDTYLHDRNEERCRNTMRNNDITFEEYMESDDDGSSKIMLGVKAGECIYLVHMPISSTYGRITTSDSMYYYGKRSSYAPYQIFWKDAPLYPSDTTQVGFPDTGYRLADILDGEQKIWLPVFLQETISLFFGAEEVPHKEYWFHQELVSLSPISQEKTLPMCANELSTYSTMLTIPAPEEVLEENDLFLAKYFGITQDSLISVPVLPNEFMEIEKCKVQFSQRCADAYKKEIAVNICKLSTTRLSTWTYVDDIIRGRLKDIWNELLDGKYDGFTEVTIEGTPVMDKDGNQTYTEKWVKGEKKRVPITIKTSTDDCKAWGRGHFAILVNGFEKKKYPVCVRIRPTCAEHYSNLLDRPIEELPPMLQISEQLHVFYEKYNRFFSHLDKRDRWDNNVQTISAQRFANINFCMAKKDWKHPDRYAILYENRQSY